MKLNIYRNRTKFRQFDDNKDLYCYKCSKYKKICEYDISKQKSNIKYRNGLDRRCKSCKFSQYQKRKQNNRGKEDLDRLLLERWHGLKIRASNKNYDITFDWKYLKILWNNQNGKCAISGLEMTYIMNNGRIPTNLSIDKINPTMGYTEDNIQLVCMAVNQMKSDMTLELLLEFCKNIISYNENKN